MKSVNVLLIEQASGESRHIRHVLESSATMSYSVDQVESLDQALARLQGTAIDVAILDCAVLEGGGREAFQAAEKQKAEREETAKQVRVGKTISSFFCRPFFCQLPFFCDPDESDDTNHRNPSRRLRRSSRCLFPRWLGVRNGVWLPLLGGSPHVVETGGLQIVDHGANAAGGPAGMHGGPLLVIVLNGPRNRHHSIPHGDAHSARGPQTMRHQLLFQLVLQTLIRFAIHSKSSSKTKRCMTSTGRARVRNLRTWRKLRTQTPWKPGCEARETL